MASSPLPTPANRPDSLEYSGAQQAQFDPNYRSFYHKEQLQEQAAVGEEDEGRISPEEDPVMRQFAEDVANEENLFAELQTASGIDQIITENEKLITEKNELSREVEELLSQLRDSQSNIQLTESSLTSLKEENKSLTTKVGEPEGTVKKLNQDLEEEREKERQRSELKDSVTSRWPVYLSLLEQIRMSDELSLFKSKSKKSRWVDYVDGMQLSIHCHINAVKTLVCAPGQVAKDTATLDRGIVISTEDRKPALFVISCGEGHLDLRTADKVMQSLLAKDSNQSGLPSPAMIISEKNYIIVWEISS